MSTTSFVSPISSDLLDKIARYQPSAQAVATVCSHPLLFVAGTSGAGKETVLGELTKEGDFHVIVSHTSRAPRLNDGVMEQSGVEYYFVDLDEIERMVDAHEFVEVKYTHGKVYGTSVAEFTKAADEHKIAVSAIDVKGVQEYRLLKPDTTVVFIVPPSTDEWVRRLKRRYGDNWHDHREELRIRMATAEAELQHVLSAATDYHLLINDDIAQTRQHIENIVAGNSAEVDAQRPEARAIAEAMLVMVQQQPF